MIDFSKTTSNILECFDDVGILNIFFLRLQAETGITLYEQESLIIFDEVQLFPKARQAIKHLVHDGRYSYLETGSLISIKKNVKDILIPSEEMKLEVYPMDYEEFCDATGNNSRKILRKSMHPEGYLHYIMRFRHSWQRMQESIVLPRQSEKGSTHYYEVDFLISEGSKINAFEIKFSGSGKHESIKEFCRKFSQNISKAYLISQKDAGKEENLLLKPFYLLPFLVK